MVLPAHMEPSTRVRRAEPGGWRGGEAAAEGSVPPAARWRAGELLVDPDRVCWAGGAGQRPAVGGPGTAGVHPQDWFTRLK